MSSEFCAEVTAVLVFYMRDLCVLFVLSFSSPGLEVWDCDAPCDFHLWEQPVVLCVSAHALFACLCCVP